MNEEVKKHWLTRRLKELGKTKADFAKKLDVNNARIYELENGLWKLQVSHIKKAAEFLEFDRTAFLDFISGDITEEELWNYEKPVKITDEDLALLKAVKSIASRPQASNDSSDSEKSPTISPKTERNR